mmetsp:Transcript_143731/g.400620  ORF Transcript_143731/g.400620 Transcript_143731/m.400620 type:complete len:409 (+) Transcript_143731:1-1227(+)
MHVGIAAGATADAATVMLPTWVQHDAGTRSSSAASRAQLLLGGCCRQLRRSGALRQQSPLVLGLQLEHALEGPDLVLLGVDLFVVLHGVVDGAEQLVDDVSRELVHSRPLLLVEPVQLLGHLIGLGQADALGHGLQGGQVGHRSLGGLPQLVLVDLLRYEPLCLQHLGLALLGVGLYDLLQVVHRVGCNSLHLRAIRCNVERHGDVNEHEVPFEGVQVGLGDDRLLAAGGCEDHVTVPHDVPHLGCRGHGCTRTTAVGDLVEECLSLVDRAVDEGELDVGVLAVQRNEEEPRHLASPDDARVHITRVLPQVMEDLGHHELHGRAGHGDGAFADLGARPHELARPDRRIEHLRDDLASGPSHGALVVRLPLLDAVLVAGLDLREDLGLAEHQGVQAGHDLEQVLRRIFS